MRASSPAPPERQPTTAQEVGDGRLRSRPCRFSSPTPPARRKPGRGRSCFHTTACRLMLTPGNGFATYAPLVGKDSGKRPPSGTRWRVFAPYSCLSGNSWRMRCKADLVGGCRGRRNDEPEDPVRQDDERAEAGAGLARPGACHDELTIDPVLAQSTGPIGFAIATPLRERGWENQIQ